MKKTLAILACIVMLLSTVGCKKDKKKEKPEASAKDSSAVDSKINISDYSEVNSSEKTQANDTARKFCTALKDKNYDALSKLISVSDKKVFNLLSGVELKDFELTYLEQTGSRTYSYRLRFKADCKDNNLFTNGENVFSLVVKLNPYTNAWKVIDFNTENRFFEPIPSQYDYYDVSITNCHLFEYLRDELPLLTDHDYISSTADTYSKFDLISLTVLDLYLANSSFRDDGISNFKPAEINKYISDTFYVHDFKIEKSLFYDKESGYAVAEATDIPFPYFNKVTSFNELDNSEFEIVINYYADTASFFKAKTVKYIVKSASKNKYIVKSRAVLFDNKFPLMNNR